MDYNLQKFKTIKKEDDILIQLTDNPV